MSKYYIDTEFFEDGPNHPIRLISIGIVCDDGRELYLENIEFDWSVVPEHHWLQENVRPHLSSETKYIDNVTMPIIGMAHKVKEFVTDESPEFYGYYADYDWVVLCQLFGSMVNLPKNFPMYCRDLKQIMDAQGRTDEWRRAFCPDPQGEHNAIVDARWNQKLHQALMKL